MTTRKPVLHQEIKNNRMIYFLYFVQDQENDLKLTSFKRDGSIEKNDVNNITINSKVALSWALIELRRWMEKDI
jgi:hypothetical protein